MQRTSSSPKRSAYPLSTALILILHLGLGYAVYQYATTPGAGTEPKAPVATATIVP
ncbi:MAG: hypothetical protein ABMA02_07250 [Saprospiraceae bacterium]